MKVTIYTTNSFFGHITKTEAKLTETGRKDYAQYTNAPYAKFIPKGKRTEHIVRATSYPYLLIIEGWNHPEPDDMMSEAQVDSNGTKFSQSRYSSFDERYKTDFDTIINPYLENQKVIMDIRQTAGKEVINETNNNPRTAQTNPAG